jgi:hypothetical protein
VGVNKSGSEQIRHDGANHAELASIRIRVTVDCVIPTLESYGVIPELLEVALEICVAPEVLKASSHMLDTLLQIAVEAYARMSWAECLGA